MKIRDHSREELSFYSNATTDIEFKFPFGFGELWGIADRTDYDLKAHMNHSSEDLTYFDQELNEKYIPYCIEPSLGVDRLLLSVMCSAYDEEYIKDGDIRTVLRFHPAIAPVKLVYYLYQKKLSDKAMIVYEKLSKNIIVSMMNQEL